MQYTKRCAIVHHSSGLRRWLRTTLSGMGYSVISLSATAEEGLRRACLMKPDFMLVDAGSAGSYRGIGMMRDIQQQLPMPVLYIASDLGPKMIAAARPTHPLGFLNRPLRARDLLAVLEVSRVSGAAALAPDSSVRVREPPPAAGGLQVQLSGALDCLAVGVVIVHRELRVRYVNFMGRRILRNSTLLTLSNDRLVLADPGIERRLCRWVQEAAGGALTLGHAAGPMPPLRILVCPIPAADPDHGIAALYLAEPGEQLKEVELQLRRYYRLTRAEARVVRALLVRPGRAAVARQLFISIQTV